MNLRVTENENFGETTEEEFGWKKPQVMLINVFL